MLADHKIACSDACMVGDRPQDVVGARENGIGAIGVLWGYGSAEELEEAGADFLASSMAAVREGIGCLPSACSRRRRGGGRHQSDDRGGAFAAEARTLCVLKDHEEETSGGVDSPRKNLRALSIDRACVFNTTLVHFRL